MKEVSELIAKKLTFVKYEVLDAFLNECQKRGVIAFGGAAAIDGTGQYFYTEF